MSEEKELMRIKSSPWAPTRSKVGSGWGVLIVSDRAVYGEVARSLFKTIKMSLPFDRIAQVNIVQGIFFADIEVVNKGGTDNLIIRYLTNSNALSAKSLIEERINVASPTLSSVSIADEITKLASLRERNLLTESEFQIEKNKLLARK